MVLEDAMMHIVDSFIRETGSDRLVLTGGTALNALANMRLLEHFDEDYNARVTGRDTRLHLWVPPVPSDAGVTLGAAYAFTASAGARQGAPLRHAFYCGRGATTREMLSALKDADDLDWHVVGSTAERGGIEAVADLMADITARDGIIACRGPARRARARSAIARSSLTPAIRVRAN
jgi:carbamoyltransferase